MTIEARVGFSKRPNEPSSLDDIAVPGYPDNRISLRTCVVHDARQADVGLEREGFMLARHESAYANEHDRAVLTRSYYPEVADFLRQELDAALVIPSQPSALLVRYGDRLVGRRIHDGRTDVIDDRIPASFAHVDYIRDAGLQSCQYEMQAAGLQDFEYSRMIVVQTWRAISAPPQDVPLAICDRRSLDDADLSPITGILSPENAAGLEDPSFQVGGIHFSPEQRWYYYPHMKPDELLIFTGYDTAHPDGWKVGHAAFDNRHTHPEGSPRVSIEARFYAFFQ